MFVGGAVISLYTDDQQPRNTSTNIDFTINIVNVGEFLKTIEELGKLGFHQTLMEHLFAVTHTKISSRYNSCRRQRLWFN